MGGRQYFTRDQYKNMVAMYIKANGKLQDRITELEAQLAERDGVIPMKEDKPFQPGWMEKQLDYASKEVEKWPQWMKDCSRSGNYKE